MKDQKKKKITFHSPTSFRAIQKVKESLTVLFKNSLFSDFLG